MIWGEFAGLKQRVEEEVGAQPNDASRRGVAAHVRRALRAAGVPEHHILSFTAAVVDESDFMPSLEWSRLGQLQESVSERMRQQAEEAEPSEHRGVAAHVRQELLAIGVPEGHARLASTALVVESTVKPSVDWAMLGGLRERVAESMEQQRQVSPSQQRGIAAHVRQELVAAGVEEEQVYDVAVALVSPSAFRESLDWSKIRQLKQQVMHLMELQAETVSLSETRGVAAHVRQELEGAGVGAEHVASIARAVVDESSFNPSLNWDCLGGLKEFVLSLVQQQLGVVDAMETRGIAAHVRQELQGCGVQAENARSMAAALVHESAFKASVNLTQLSHVKDRVWERLEEQGQQVDPSNWHSMATHMQEELVSAGIPTGAVQHVLLAVVNESPWKESLDWTSVVAARGHVVERFRMGRIVAAAERRVVAAEVRVRLIAAGVPHDQVDRFMRHWFPAVEAAGPVNATFSAARDVDTAGADTPCGLLSSPALIAGVAIAMCCLGVAGAVVFLRGPHTNKPADCVDIEKAQTVGKDENTAGAHEFSKDVDTSEVASTAIPSDNCSEGTEFEAV